MTTAWTPRAIIESYPGRVHADRLSKTGYAVALLLTAIATFLLFETFAITIDFIGSILGIWRALHGFHSIQASVGATGYVLGIATRMLVILILFSMTLRISILLYRVAGQLYLKRSGSRALDSLEPPIIFLRPFLTDIRPIAPPNFGSFLLRRRWWPEEVFAESARDCGRPVLAIASPQARLPSIGAAKIYVVDSHWQRVVEELCSHATLVVLRVGTTAGIRWELDMLAEKLCQGIRLALLFCGPRGEPVDGRNTSYLSRSSPRLCAPISRAQARHLLIPRIPVLPPEPRLRTSSGIR